MSEKPTSTADEKMERRGIQSVEIAFRLLSVLQKESQSLPLKEIAIRAEMTSSAANNYFVSLVRTGLAVADEKPGYYKLGPAAVLLGMSAIKQTNGFDLVRRELSVLRDATQRSAAITTWSEDGVLSLFKLDGKYRGAFELRTGIIPLVSTSAGKVFVACMPKEITAPFIEREWLETPPANKGDIQSFQDETRRELERKKYATIHRTDVSGYASIAAPILDWSGEVKFAISLVGSRTTLQTDKGSEHVQALLDSAEKVTSLLGGARK